MQNPTIILAAGLGARMQSDPQSCPKAMTRLGTEQRPFLEFLLKQLQREGCSDACVVIHPEDRVTAAYFEAHPIKGIELSYAIQLRSDGREKPLGTAHAAGCGLTTRPDWSGQTVAVCNGDNLPPDGAFRTLFSSSSRGALLAFDREGLCLPAERTRAFAVIHTDLGGALTNIVEKPNDAQIEAARSPLGTVQVSMNLFSLEYSEFIKAVNDCPVHLQRDEKELPTAMLRWSQAHPNELACIPFSGRFLDLTRPEDISNVERRLGL